MQAAEGVQVPAPGQAALQIRVAAVYVCGRRRTRSSILVRALGAAAGGPLASDGTAARRRGRRSAGRLCPQSRSMSVLWQPSSPDSIVLHSAVHACMPA